MRIGKMLFRLCPELIVCLTAELEPARTDDLLGHSQTLRRDSPTGFGTHTLGPSAATRRSAVKGMSHDARLAFQPFAHERPAAVSGRRPGLPMRDGAAGQRASVVHVGSRECVVDRLRRVRRTMLDPLGGHHRIPDAVSIMGPPVGVRWPRFPSCAVVVAGKAEHTDGGTWRGASHPPGQHRPATSPTSGDRVSRAHTAEPQVTTIRSRWPPRRLSVNRMPRSGHGGALTLLLPRVVGPT